MTIWPVEFTTQSYQFVLENPAFGKSFLVSLLRVLVGTPVNMILTILVAYPLSQVAQEFRAARFLRLVLPDHRPVLRRPDPLVHGHPPDRADRQLLGADHPGRAAGAST